MQQESSQDHATPGSDTSFPGGQWPDLREEQGKGPQPRKAEGQLGNQGARLTSPAGLQPLAQVPVGSAPHTRQGNPWCSGKQTSRCLPATAVLAVVVVVAVALVVVPFLVPVTNSILGGREHRVRPGQSRRPHLLASHLPVGDRSLATHKGGTKRQLCWDRLGEGGGREAPTGDSYCSEESCPGRHQMPPITRPLHVPGDPRPPARGMDRRGKEHATEVKNEKTWSPPAAATQGCLHGPQPLCLGVGGGGILEAIAAAGGPGQTRAGKATCPELLLEILVKKCLGHTWAHSYSSIPEGPPLLGKRRGSGS